ITGLNMVGFAGNTAVATDDETKENYILNVFNEYKDKKEVIAITHTLFEKIRSYIKNFQSQHPNSVILELPDMKGKGEDNAWKMLSLAIGEDRAKALAIYYRKSNKK
ncbi:MAG: V-type ATP synthase subunit F, partial [Candidatus Altarchaeaceae archaeon]